MSKYIISLKELAILMAKCHGMKLVEEDGTPVCDPSEIAEGIDKPLELKEIVRCRDCRRFHTNTNGLDCPKLDPDGFCAWGERREQ